MRSTVAGPHRLVEHDRVVGHHRLGQPEALLQVEVHLQRQRLLGAARAPSGAGRNHTDSIVGGAIGPSVSSAATVVVPEERVAVLDRRAAGPDVALL